MLLVDTHIAASKIHGLGLFAVHDIPKDTVVSKLDTKFDNMIPKIELDTEFVPPAASDHVRAYAFLHDDVYYLPGDNDKFCNHSDDPNILYSFDSILGIAARDIKAGEELTCNYYSFDQAAAEKLKEMK
jgi:SET domain-containing protein